MPTLVSRTFMNGNSQAVRIPQEFRLEARKVEITRADNGDLIIHPLPLDRGAALLAALEGFDDDFLDALEADRLAQAEMQDREAL
ncbi:MAG: AbrB/MazE/SpoVT family DNA-binding domain-containing protein [Proteobacteria bacterium]|nr:AbrB/MazE/SpoVT family DNA-binding domain-containing protein [Pseudomonadota bacterium]MBS0551705.1 AbrB/MazE/SpoVT family DNA-binding domain-containing protein [Pseudomonadota bacterium]